MPTHRPERAPVARWSRTLVLVTVILFAVGLVLGALTLFRDAPGEAHRPQDNAITVHLVIGAVLVLAAVVVTVVRRSPRWLVSLWTYRTGERIRLTFGAARRSLTGGLRCVVFVAMAVLIGYLVLRMGMQVTAGLDPAFTRNAWGGPSAIGAFLAHGADALLGIAGAGTVAHLALRNPEGDHGAGTETARPRGAGQRQL